MIVSSDSPLGLKQTVSNHLLCNMQDFKASSVFYGTRSTQSWKQDQRFSSTHAFTKYTETAALTSILLCSLDLVAEWKCCLLYWDLQYIYTQSQVFRFSKSHLFILTIISSFMFCCFTLMRYVFQQSWFCTYSCSRKWRALGKSAGGLLLASRNHEAYLVLFYYVKFS